MLQFVVLLHYSVFSKGKRKPDDGNSNTIFLVNVDFQSFELSQVIYNHQSSPRRILLFSYHTVKRCRSKCPKKGRDRQGLIFDYRVPRLVEPCRLLVYSTHKRRKRVYFTNGSRKTNTYPWLVMVYTFCRASYCRGKGRSTRCRT